MPVYDFICAEGHVAELRRSYDDDVTACPQCGDVAVRNPINPSVGLVMETGPVLSRRAAVPRDERYLKPQYDIYREAAAEVDHVYTRAEESQGHALNPRLWERGKQQAMALKARGVTAEEFAKRRHT